MTLLREVRLVPVAGVAAPLAPVDLRIVDGVIVDLAPSLNRLAGEEVHDAQGRWAIPGLWDQHVHLGQWALARSRLPLAGTTAPEDVCRLVRSQIDSVPTGSALTLQGFGYRSASWSRPPTVAELDAVSGDRPVVLVSGDAHNGWLNSAALRLLGVPPRDEPLAENDWFALFPRLAELPGLGAPDHAAYEKVVAAAAAMGVVGVVDLEFAANYLDWPERVAAGIDGLRVRVGTYPDLIDDVIAAGLRTGDLLAPGVELGRLKIISDGSLNTRTAFCHSPYADSADLTNPRGVLNYRPAELVALLGRAKAAGIESTVHVIGDDALSAALDAFAATGARGALEHVQLVAWDDIPRIAALGLTASVQPAHLLDDRDVTGKCWPDREDRVYPFRSLLDAGVRVVLGSDAPVSPLDPWLAMAAAVHRSADSRPPWHPEQALTAAEALAASTDGRGTLAVGSPADLVLLDRNPLASPFGGNAEGGAADPGGSAAAAAQLRAVVVEATMLAGRWTHSLL